jgi:hypothetical protein
MCSNKRRTGAFIYLFIKKTIRLPYLQVKFYFSGLVLSFSLVSEATYVAVPLTLGFWNFVMLRPAVVAHHVNIQPTLVSSFHFLNVLVETFSLQQDFWEKIQVLLQKMKF